MKMKYSKMIHDFVFKVTSNFKVILALTVLFTGIYFKNDLHVAFKHYFGTDDGIKEGVFSQEVLARYNGIIDQKLYIAVLGIVYDVSSGRQHYAKNAPYHYFVGKDGSRALVTGDFKDESRNKDHILDLPCVDIFGLLNWQSSLEKKYKKIGILSGRYYNGNGQKTTYFLKFNKKVDECVKERDNEKKKGSRYPSCNIAWSEHEGTKVWCTKNSGGIQRDWVGVPRQMYTPGDAKPRCVCINPIEGSNSVGHIKEYEGCSNTSVTCFIQSD